MQSVGERQLLEMLRSRAQMDLEARRRALELERPKVKRKSLQDLIRLQGIMEVRGTLTAIVNGEMVAKGQKILGATVVRITSTSVTFEHKGKLFTKKVRGK